MKSPGFPGFFEAFHRVWGKDNDERGESSEYDKKAWTYVQTRLEEYFEDSSKDSRRKDA